MLRALIAISAGLVISSTALAEPLSLTDKQMDQVTAGSFVFDPASQPALAGANPTGGQGGLVASFGPKAGLHPNLAAWIAHGATPPGSPSQGQVGDNTPLNFGGDI